jgi:hypothetical protein
LDQKDQQVLRDLLELRDLLDWQVKLAPPAKRVPKVNPAHQEFSSLFPVLDSMWKSQAQKYPATVSLWFP